MYELYREPINVLKRLTARLFPWQISCKILLQVQDVLAESFFFELLWLSTAEVE